MGKKILSVIIGYLVMAVFIFITFLAAYMILGTEGAFQPNSYEVTAAWVAASIILGFIGAVIGGLVCRLIGKSGQTSLVLAVIVLILGIVLAIPTLSDQGSDKTAVRTDSVGAMEAMQDAHQPTWLAFLNPLLGAAGVMVGSRLKKSGGNRG
jgi:hypothetical protein